MSARTFCSAVAIGATTVLAGCIAAGGVPSGGPPPAHEAVGCESQAGPGEAEDVRCTIDPARSGRRFRFQADFVGSHDDTSLAMTATLGGSPLACDDGSRLRSAGEDGEVSLDCTFALAPDVASPVAFIAEVRWHHAQYIGHALRAR